MQPLREYQFNAMAAVRQSWQSGSRRVLLVSPTGSGKTRMGEDGTTGFHHVLWLAHRKELINDAATRLALSFGGLEVGIVSAGVVSSQYSRIQVSSVQTLLRRNTDTWPAADLVVLDEAHHFMADEWGRLAAHYPLANHIALTATPERPDGRALAGIADVMVVAAKHSQLLADGHLCDVRIFAPERVLGDGLAMDPATAWHRYAEGQPGFAFFGSLDMAYECEHKMNTLGIRAAVIEQGTDKGDRKRIIQELRDGALDCICNVYTMTEGVDVPRAAVCMLASPVSHCGQYLQKTGRVLRPHASKQRATIIDLVSAYLSHGSPVDDREYSFDGEPIRRVSLESLRNCPKCGRVNLSATPDCAGCGYAFPVAQRGARSGPEIHDVELKEITADATISAKREHYQRLRKLQRANGFDLYFVVKEFKRIFGEPCVISDATDEEKRAFYGKMIRIGKARGTKSRYPDVMFNQMFGHWPRKKTG